jgi:hypothetical protein
MRTPPINTELTKWALYINHNSKDTSTQLFYAIKEPPRRRITVTSSLKGISTEIRWRRGEEALLGPPLYLFLQQASRQIFKDDMNGLSSTLGQLINALCLYFF